MYDSKYLIFEIRILIHLVENGTLVNIPSIDNKENFWNVIRVFQNGILAGIDLFTSTPPLPHSTTNHPIKRKSIEFNSGKYPMINFRLNSYFNDRK